MILITVIVTLPTIQNSQRSEFNLSQKRNSMRANIIEKRECSKPTATQYTVINFIPVLSRCVAAILSKGLLKSCLKNQGTDF